MGRRRTRAVLLAVLLAGCAPRPMTDAARPEVVPVPKAGPAPSEPPPSPPAPARPWMPRDSTMTADAARVVASLPEPLDAASAVPPLPPPPRTLPVRDSVRVPRSAEAPADMFDSLRTTPLGDADVAVPVPVETKPLGDRLGPDDAKTAVARDTSAASTPGAPSPSPPVMTPPPGTPAIPPPARPATPPAAGPCFRVQVVAPVEADKAAAFRSAAESQLLVPMVVEREAGLHKVRTRDCLPRAAADALKARAVGAGFSGVFLVAPKK